MSNRHPHTSPHRGSADNTLWSGPAAVTVLIVSTLAYGFGNADAVAHSPLWTLGANAAITAGVFAALAGLDRIIGGRLPAQAHTTVLLVGVIALSGARGALLFLTNTAIGFSGGNALGQTIATSVFVFGLGVILSVLAVSWVGQWRTLQARIRQLSQQRQDLQSFVADTVAAHTSEIASQVRDRLQPQISGLGLQDASSAQDTLKTLVTAVVKPVSTSLHNDFPSVTIPPARTVFVSATEFFRQAIRGRPFRPLITGALFVIGLAPANLSEGVTVAALLWTVGIGAVVTVGTWLINLLSATALRQLSLPIHALILIVSLGLVGLLIGHLPAALGEEGDAQASYYLTGPVATILLAMLVGGVANGRQYFRQEQDRLKRLKRDLSHELARARSLQWQRNQTLATILHGSLQSVLNATAIRLARATSAEEAQSVTRELVVEVDTILETLRSPDQHATDLATTISRITDTWEDIAQISWQINDQLVAAVSGHPVSHAISDCLIETVYNAIKHQAPKTIDVSLDSGDSDNIVLTVTHPGVLAEERPAGLGTKILDYLTLQHRLRQRGDIVEFVGEFASPVRNDRASQPQAGG